MRGHPATLESTSRRAQVVAEAAAVRAGIVVDELSDVEDHLAVASLLDRIWSSARRSQMPPEIIRAISHGGGYVGGARLDGRLVGALVGFLSRSGGGLALHSQILGIDAHLRDRGVGLALKLHQRAWALAAGLDTITWTFDPLMSRNAYFNLTRLGAAALEYHVNFYGEMNDAINAGDESDRLLVAWRLDHPRVMAALEGPPRDLDVDALRKAGAAVVVEPAPDGSPLLSPTRADILLCGLPPDIAEIRRRRPAVARAWRSAVREALGRALHEGLRVRGFARSGWYVVGED